MKIIERDVMRVLPGKMAEAMELSREEMTVYNSLGINPSVKRYVPFTGSVDRLHTIITDTDLGSFTSIEAAMKKAQASPEMQEIFAKWQAIIVDHILELYMVED